MTQSAFEKIAAGMQAAIDYVEGARTGYVVHIPKEVDLKGIRKVLGLSQGKFAATFGFSPGRIKDWEQKRYPIDTASRVLLTVIEKEPEAVLRALGGTPDGPPRPRAGSVGAGTAGDPARKAGAKGALKHAG